MFKLKIFNKIKSNRGLAKRIYHKTIVNYNASLGLKKNYV